MGGGTDGGILSQGIFKEFWWNNKKDTYNEVKIKRLKVPNSQILYQCKYCKSASRALSGVRFLEI